MSACRCLIKPVMTSKVVVRNCALGFLPRLVFYSPYINAHPVSIDDFQQKEKQSSRGVEEGQIKCPEHAAGLLKWNAIGQGHEPKIDILSEPPVNNVRNAKDRLN